MSAHFPKYTSAQLVGEKGVATVNSIVSLKLNWIFRRVPQEADFGIDGYIDLVEKDAVTGQMLAVQIKSGDAYLTRKTEYGYTYHGELKHLNHYLNHPVEVVLIICDPKSGQAWWVKFDPDATEGTKSGWVITIPFTNALDGNSKAALATIAGPAVDHNAALQEFWQVNRTLKDASLIHFIIDRKDIEIGNFSPIKEFFQKLQASPEMIGKKRNSVVCSIYGYESDPRELFEISEVRMWMMQVEGEVKYWGYFLSLDKKLNPFFFLLMICVCETSLQSKNHPRGKILTFTDTRLKHAFLIRHFLWLNEFTQLHGIGLDVNRQISDSMSSYLESYGESPEIEG